VRDSKRIALLEPSLPTAAELLPWLEQIDSARRYTNFGPLCRRLETELAASLATDCEVVAVSSGTLGIELALAAWRLPQGARVLLPALSFVATATALMRAGLVPVFADVDPDNWCLTPEIARAAAEQIDAVLPVAVFGRALNPALWDAFTADTGLSVLIDAAGAYGNQLPGRRTAAVFSMHATKALAAGEGGFVACPDPDLARAIRTGSNFGFDYENPRPGVVQHAGTNAKLSEYHAAVGLAALTAWPAQCAQRIDLAKTYATELRELGDKIILQDDGAPWSRSVFVLRAPSGIDATTVTALTELGVESRRWYWPPLHRHPAFADCERIGDLARTEMLAAQLIGLPFHLHLDDDDVARVCVALDSVLP